MHRNKSILFVQNGDFAEAYNRFAEGGLETYRDQKASVDFVAGLAASAKIITFAFGDDKPLVELAPNLLAISGNRGAFSDQQIASLFDETEVTHLVLRTPDIGFLREAVRRSIPVLPSFADIFDRKGLRGRYRNWKLRRALIQSKAPCFSNHSLNASQSLADALRLPKGKIVPWDWTKVPLSGDAKSQVRDPDRPTAFFAGTLSIDKGVGDCLDAIALLRDAGILLDMYFAGPGDVSGWIEHAERLGIAEQVKFLGMLPNTEVRRKMHESDFVIVPSRHSYAEGLPNTIYEGLASRSALVISDHPAFAGRLKPDAECLVFTAADPKSLCTCIRRGVQDSELYGRLSRNSPTAHDQLYVGMDWGALVTAFLDDPTNQSGWVEMNSLEMIGGK